jgi:hypothetical protein
VKGLQVKLSDIALGKVIIEWFTGLMTALALLKSPRSGTGEKSIGKRAMAVYRPSILHPLP